MIRLPEGTTAVRGGCHAQARSGPDTLPLFEPLANNRLQRTARCVEEFEDEGCISTSSSQTAVFSS